MSASRSGSASLHWAVARQHGARNSEHPRGAVRCQHPCKRRSKVKRVIASSHAGRSASPLLWPPQWHPIPRAERTRPGRGRAKAARRHPRRASADANAAAMPQPLAARLHRYMQGWLGRSVVLAARGAERPITHPQQAAAPRAAAVPRAPAPPAQPSGRSNGSGPQRGCRRALRCNDARGTHQRTR